MTGLGVLGGGNGVHVFLVDVINASGCLDEAWDGGREGLVVAGYLDIQGTGSGLGVPLLAWWRALWRGFFFSNTNRGA